MITITPTDPAARTPEVMKWCETVAEIVEKEYLKQLFAYFSRGNQKET